MPGPSRATAKAKPAEPAKSTTYEDAGDGFVSGNLTRDPELRFTPGGRPVANLRVAESIREKDPETHKWVDKGTSFFDVQVWGAQATNLVECVSKGDRVVAVGTWQKQAWTDRDGVDRTKMVLVARDIGPSLLFRFARVEPKQEGGQE